MSQVPTAQDVHKSLSKGYKGKAERQTGQRRAAKVATELTAEEADKAMLTRTARAARAGQTAAKKRKIPAAKAGATREGYKLAKRPASLGGGYFWKKVI